MMNDREVINFLLDAIAKAVHATGGATDIGVERILARGLGVSPGNFANWKARGQIPARWVPTVWMLANKNGAGLPAEWLVRAVPTSEPIEPLKRCATTKNGGPSRVIKPAEGIKRTPSGVRKPPKRPPPRKGSHRGPHPTA